MARKSSIDELQHFLENQTKRFFIYLLKFELYEERVAVFAKDQKEAERMINDTFADDKTIELITIANRSLV